MKCAAPSLAAATLALGSFAAPNSVAAQVLALEDIVEINVLEGWRRPDGAHIAALDVRLAPGWKTYWRSPGDGGIPPELALDSVTAAEIQFPRPEIFFAGGMRSIGYQGDVLLPLELTVAPGPHVIDGEIEIGICREVCMPVSLPISAALPDGGRPDPRIVAALTDRPLSAEEAGASAATCRITPISDGLRIEAQMAVPDTGNDETVVFELPDPSVWVSEADVERSGSQVTAAADLVPAVIGPFALDRGQVRITVIGSRNAIEIMGCSAG